MSTVRDNDGFHLVGRVHPFDASGMGISKTKGHWDSPMPMHPDSLDSTLTDET